MAEVKDYSAEALLRKEKEVELDTDDVKETDVEIKETEKPKDETPNLKVSEEVDLGYTDHPQKDEEKKEKPQIEIKEDDPQPEVSRETSEEKTEENQDKKPDLQEHNRNYQKRIDKLVYRAKEAERKEQAA